MGRIIKMYYTQILRTPFVTYIYWTMKIFIIMLLVYYWLIFCYYVNTIKLTFKKKIVKFNY